jgi:hypothetical protein
MPASSLTLLLSSASMNSFVLQNNVIPELVFKIYKPTSSSVYKLLTFRVGFYIDPSSNIKPNPNQVRTALKSMKYISMYFKNNIIADKQIRMNSNACQALYT